MPRKRENKRTSAKTKQLAAKRTSIRSASQVELSHDVFDALDVNADGFITKNDFLDALDMRGILASDPRLKETVKALSKYKSSQKLSYKDLKRAVHHNITIVERAIKGLLAIPNFESFRDKVRDIYDKTLRNKKGAVADYIPQLAKVKPEQYGISVCTVDGQQFNIGDYNVPYSIQSTCKPINYGIALDDNGEDYVHKHVGREQSGFGFNEITLNSEGLPHNPMINAGAIMSCSMIKPNLKPETRLRYIMDKWQALAGEAEVGFDKDTFESEKSTADRNFALAYFMQEHGAFPKGTNVLKTLDLYFQACSIQLDARAHAIAAGTLANGGVCPTNGQKVFGSQTVKHCLSMMYSSGMYDYSGEFAFSIGLPAKSGVAGAVMLVVPGVMGITTWSPRLDSMGNSVRGIEFCQEFIKAFDFHVYDSLGQEGNKVDPRLQDNEAKMRGVMAACHAASQGDLNELKRLEAGGVDLNEADYDLRSPVHLAASEGQEHIVRFLISRGIKLSPKDRWGGTPLGDAIREGHKRVTSLLRNSGAKK